MHSSYSKVHCCHIFERIFVRLSVYSILWRQYKCMFLSDTCESLVFSVHQPTFKILHFRPYHKCWRPTMNAISRQVITVSLCRTVRTYCRCREYSWVFALLPEIFILNWPLEYTRIPVYMCEQHKSAQCTHTHTTAISSSLIRSYAINNSRIVCAYHFTVFRFFCFVYY